MSFELMIEVINDFREKLKDLNELEFMSVMCMFFDEYHRIKPDGMSAPEMAEMVFTQVSAVNDALGEY